MGRFFPKSPEIWELIRIALSSSFSMNSRSSSSSSFLATTSSPAVGYLTVKDVVPILNNLYEDFDKAFFLEQAGKSGLPDNKKIKDFPQA